MTSTTTRNISNIMKFYCFFRSTRLGRSFGITKWANVYFLMELSNFMFLVRLLSFSENGSFMCGCTALIPILLKLIFSFLQTLQLKKETPSVEPVGTFWIQGAVLGRRVGSSYCKLYLALPFFCFIFTKEKKEVLNYIVTFNLTYRVSGKKSIHWHKICFLLN